MNLKKLLALATIPAMALALTACGGKKAPAPAKTPAASASAPAPAAAPVSVDAESWAAEWRSDKAAFHQKYAGNPVKLTGEVERIVDGVTLRVRSGIIFKVKDKTKADLVQAFISNEQLPEIKKLKPGEKITVSCVAKENPVFPTCDNTDLVK